MKKRRWVGPAIVIVAVLVVWNWPLKYRIGVDGELLTKRIPLYAKACGFLYRDWMYKDIVREITTGEKDDIKKALAIFRWTGKNIKVGVPGGIKSVDDHPLNIIIRQYGSPDQRDDVFTILCAYAGMKGGVAKCFDANTKRAIRLSFVRIKGRWLVFDAGRQKYFSNKKGEVGSVEDYLKGDLVLSVEDFAYYGGYLPGLKDVDLSRFTRADEQMPFRRLPAQVRKMAGGTKGDEDI